MYNLGPFSARMDFEDIANPFNSSMFRHVVSQRSAQLFVQRFVTNEIIPKYEIEEEQPSPEDSVVIPGEEESEDLAQDDANATDKKCKDGAKEEDIIPDIIYKTMPATVHLANPVVISQDGQDFVAAVSGVKLNPDYLQTMLMDSTESDSQAVVELACQDTTELMCYLVDFSANVLASNQDLAVVELGNFLGSVDPQLMKQLIEEDKIFEEHISYNYQALCPDDIECSFGIRSVIAPTLNMLVHAIQNLGYVVQNMGHILAR